MSRPFDCDAQVPNLRQLDREAGEFWVENPFRFSASGENLSAYERNGIHLNAGDRKFHNISYLTGADSEGDGRTVAAWDVTGDGMPELFVRQAGGGALLVFRNEFPQTSWLKLSLRGTRSNRFGIGAKVECRTSHGTVRRELYPVVNFLSQSPAALHLGLGDAVSIDSLRIRWPSGETQELHDIAVNQHIIVQEDQADVRQVE